MRKGQSAFSSQLQAVICPFLYFYVGGKSPIMDQLTPNMSGFINFERLIGEIFFTIHLISKSLLLMCIRSGVQSTNNDVGCGYALIFGSDVFFSFFYRHSIGLYVMTNDNFIWHMLFDWLDLDDTQNSNDMFGSVGRIQ